MRHNSEYLGRVHEYYRETVDATIRAIHEIRKTLRIDALAFRGTSGCAVGFPAALATGMPMLHVRKGHSHCSVLVEGHVGPTIRSYLIIDDFVSSGETITKIRDQIRGMWRGKIGNGGISEYSAVPVPVGVLLYASGWHDPAAKVAKILGDAAILARIGPEEDRPDPSWSYAISVASDRGGSEPDAIPF